MQFGFLIEPEYFDSSSKEASDEKWKLIMDVAKTYAKENESARESDRVLREKREREWKEYQARLDRYNNGDRHAGEPPRYKDEMHDPF